MSNRILVAVHLEQYSCIPDHVRSHMDIFSRYEPDPSYVQDFKPDSEELPEYVTSLLLPESGKSTVERIILHLEDSMEHWTPVYVTLPSLKDEVLTSITKLESTLAGPRHLSQSTEALCRTNLEVFKKLYQYLLTVPS